MTNVHASIHEVKKSMVHKVGKPFDPTKPVADLIKNQSWLICFDEFQVIDKIKFN